ncbi:hypothetical protein [Pseudovibrio sp. SPO723]|uniref:hypothetical protein n=1 Tax=Nesiotobacter zosterae TaxID=392721 RepID=UPI0029C5FB0A|nr:hypothetical protein [Pseudovibrio sp. SPO723]MDX5593600.1 hypothetical protein [Pseudovibrio sp. SPO723]
MFSRPKNLKTLASALALIFVYAPTIAAQTTLQKATLPPLAVYKELAEGSQFTSWVTFQETADQQIIHFKPILLLHCRLKELRYSIDNKGLKERFPVPPCNSVAPFAMPSSTSLADTALVLAPGTADAVAVQVIWQDGSASRVGYFEPCRDVGSVPCAYPLN